MVVGGRGSGPSMGWSPPSAEARDIHNTMKKRDSLGQFDYSDKDKVSQYNALNDKINRLTREYQETVARVYIKR